MRNLIFILTAILLSIAGNAVAASPSFDCAAAASAVEKTICASGDLSALDRLIAEEFKIARSRDQTGGVDQRMWEMRRDQACAPENAVECLRQMLIERHAVLSRRFSPPEFHGDPDFDCNRVQSHIDKVICRTWRLRKLKTALAKAYQAALRETFRVPQDPKTSPRTAVEACGPEAPDAGELVPCLEKYMNAQIERLTPRAEYDEKSKEVRYGDSQFGTLTTDMEGQRATWAVLASRIEVLRHAGATVVGCEKMESVTNKLYPPGFSHLIYGGLCTVERAGKKHRELLCRDDVFLNLYRLDVGDRPIGKKEIAIFTAVNCASY
ncbi:MAG: lysozyme inhibitor LprI family protein [Rhodospirillaceae bacterium]